MIRNYFKIAFRNLARQKNFTIINIAGLAAGIAVCLLIFVLIQFHLSYDNFHGKKDRIFRVLTEYHHPDSPEIFYGKGVPYGMPKNLKQIFPEVQQVASFYSQGNDQMLDRQGVFVADINNPGGCPGSIGTYNHPFDHAVWVSFQETPVHIGAGVAFIGIADNIFPGLAWLSGQHFPFDEAE